MNKYDDLKVYDCNNDSVLITMKKDTWKTICKILEWTNDIYKEKRKEAELD